MATISFKLSKAITQDERRQILARITITRDYRPQIATNIFIKEEYFKDGGICPPKKGKLNFVEIEYAENARKDLSTFESRVFAICTATEASKKIELTKDWILEALSFVDRHNLNTAAITVESLLSIKEKENLKAEEMERAANKPSFFETFEQYLKTSKKSDVRDSNFRVVMRALQRFEYYTRISTKNKSYKLDIDTLNRHDIAAFEAFLREEHNLYEQFPNIFKKFPSSTDTKRKPQPRGNNTICALHNKLKAFFNWCVEQDLTMNRPYKGFEGQTSEKYGRPIYINLEERNIIADFDLSNRPQLAVQRDIFIFHCCIGCRVSDLIKLTDSNIVDGEIQYVPRKTKEERPTVCQVPLNKRALQILERYKGLDSAGRLLPFISAQKYNDSIKEIFKACGINRMVVRINPTTGEEETVPINEVASSHMARRTFVGNLYKQVKDPNLICPMSGHEQGSIAFARYRDIDRETRNELVNLID